MEHKIPMRRTHVMHTRDNRRPHYYAQQGQTQQGPVLRWEVTDDEYRMLLDERIVAKIGSFTDMGDIIYIAILLVGIKEKRWAFTDLGSAKAWCENQFAKGIT